METPTIARLSRLAAGFALATAAALLAATTPFAHAAPDSGSAKPPLNVVFIIADDLGWAEVGCYGQEKIPTPHIDRLAAEGMRFTQHYSGAPVCAPARCVLLTGKHLGHAEVRSNYSMAKASPDFDEGQFPLSDRALTFAEVFQDAGYATGAMGKWGLGPVGSSGEPNRQGFDLFYGYNCQGVAHSFYPPYLWRNTEKITINADPIPGHAKQPGGEVKLSDYIGETYAPDLMIAEAEKFIADHANEPLFLYLPFIEPHLAMHPSRESVEKFPEEWDDKPYRGGNGYLPHPRPRAGYAAMINDLDSHVGRVREALETAGILDRTLIVFTSDNGTTHERNNEPDFHVGGADPEFFNSTADLRGYKGSVYEGGLRVPTIARLPGRIPAGTVNDTPGYHPDWFPTLCDATGLDRPEGLDGESLWPVLTGEQKTLEDRRPMVWAFTGYRGQVAVRNGDFKVVRRNLSTAKPAPWEVYNLAEDRSESHDLAAGKSDLIRETEALLREELDDNETFPLTVPGVND